MRKRPNPWIAVPALVMGLLAGALAWVVTEVSCRQPGTSGAVSTCYGWAGFFAVVSFLGATVGVAVILVLVYRSIAEWREGQGR